MEKIVIINQQLCVGCGKCVNKCPKKILFIEPNTNKCQVSDETKCGKAGCCEKICPEKAIRIIS